MRTLERAGHLAHARTVGYARRVAEAHALIEQALALPDASWVVSFSGGKDSTVLLDMVRQHDPSIAVIWIDDGWDYPETLQFLTDTEQRLGYSILRIQAPLSSAFWREWGYGGDDPVPIHVADVDYGELRDYAAFVGVREQESGGRRIAGRHYGAIHRGTICGTVCWPLIHWRHEDVWAYIVSHDLAYNPVYDHLAELGVSFEQRRVGPVTAYMVWQYGSLAILRAGWPDLYSRFLVAFPYAANYT